ncbi:MAG: PIG-L family deacetylase [Chitinivibrionales bacterium]|nr:PIG-L family deacetylase [Chitinivibrionales bacterium]
MLRRLVCRALESKLLQRRRVLDDEELCAPAIVFSPHYDDETLGCGGTIALKRRAGADVTIVFMTDGSGSHGHLMDPDELGGLRRCEGECAANALGVPSAAVVNLGIRERTLANEIDSIVPRILALLRGQRPAQVFLPHPAEPRVWSTDHLATTSAVQQAVASWGEPVTLFAYPVWYWYYWPWVSISIKERAQAPAILEHSLTHRWGGDIGSCFTDIIDTRAVESTKREALCCYRSQTTRMNGAANWPILQDVAAGTFLECFFRGFEAFGCTPLRIAQGREAEGQVLVGGDA